MYSATQIDTFGRHCMRKWAWRTIEGVEGEQNEAADFGSEVHEHLERWLKYAVAPPGNKAGQLALKALPFLPMPKTPGMRVEEWFYLRWDGHMFHGKKDLELPGLVHDHKTTSALAWAKTPADLVTDIQGALYAADHLVKYNLDRVLLRWLYLPKNGERPEPREAVVTREMIAPTLEEIRYHVDAMALIKDRGLRAKDLPYNIKACDSFGGCPYREHCNLSPLEQWQAMQEQNYAAEKAAFIHEMQKQQQEKGGYGIMINPPAGFAPPPQQLQTVNGNPAVPGWAPPPQQPGPPQGFQPPPGMQQQTFQAPPGVQQNNGSAAPYQDRNTSQQPWPQPAQQPFQPPGAAPAFQPPMQQQQLQGPPAFQPPSGAATATEAGKKQRTKSAAKDAQHAEVGAAYDMIADGYAALAECARKGYL